MRLGEGGSAAPGASFGGPSLTASSPTAAACPYVPRHGVGTAPRVLVWWGDELAFGLDKEERTTTNFGCESV